MKNEAFIVNYFDKDSEPTFKMQIKDTILPGRLLNLHFVQGNPTATTV